MQSLTGAYRYPCIITFLCLRLSDQHALSYLPRILEKLVFLSLHMYLYSKKKRWKKSKNCKICKKSENVKTLYKNQEKYGSFSEFCTSMEKSVMLATLCGCEVHDGDFRKDIWVSILYRYLCSSILPITISHKCICSHIR